MAILFFLFLYAVTLVAVVIAGAWHLTRKGWTSSPFRTCLLFFAYLVICYVIGFAAVCMHPYWEDNGVEEFIPMRDRWTWAILFASVFEVILSPALWAISWVIHRKSTSASARQSAIGT